MAMATLPFVLARPSVVVVPLQNIGQRSGATSKAIGRSTICTTMAGLAWVGRRARIRRKASVERWDPTAPLWTKEDLEDATVEAEGSHCHTLVYLHAFGRCGKEYVQPMVDQLSPGFSVPWLGSMAAKGLRVILPTAPKGHQPWGPLETTWHQYESADSNRVGDLTSLQKTRQRLEKILQEEAARVGEDKVFLGGLSQGCTAALDIYVTTSLQLGGFVGSVGFVPSDDMGFVGADDALEKLLQDQVKRERPVWLQCAEDDQWVPWETLAQPSMSRVSERWPGLKLRLVRGRGHVIDQWEGDLLNEFMQTYAKDAY